jgi:hypothetical protein
LGVLAVNPPPGVRADEPWFLNTIVNPGDGNFISNADKLSESVFDLLSGGNRATPEQTTQHYFRTRRNFLTSPN